MSPSTKRLSGDTRVAWYCASAPPPPRTPPNAPFWPAGPRNAVHVGPHLVEVTVQRQAERGCVAVAAQRGHRKHPSVAGETNDPSWVTVRRGGGVTRCEGACTSCGACASYGVHVPGKGG